MIILIAIWAIILNWVAYHRKFYSLYTTSLQGSPFVRLKHLLVAFGIYLILSWLIMPFFARFLLLYLHSKDPDITTLPISLITGIQFTVMASVFFFISAYLKNQPSHIYQKIWKDRSRAPNAPIGVDIGIGIITWFLSFPIVLVISEATDHFMKAFFHLETYEQVAVKYVKLAMSQPLSLAFALLSVLVLAPVVEEYLFRGVLQTYFKKRMGIKPAILLSALCFALFHYSTSQGLGNISLLFSLLILGGYLGFIYERQGSLWASISLHMIFNAISAIRILML